MDNTVTANSDQHSSYESMNHLSSVSEISLRDFVRQSQPGVELQHGRIFAASELRSRVSGISRTRVTSSPGTRVLTQP